ncbi:hypothetical protein HJC23_011251 [Cyclotella cryptica]|uniref:Uncharacterized protein n=1 Tax=Cyclotella cryptica TaxID=29204 RepID=A0ABD3QVS6_9STRA
MALQNPPLFSNKSFAEEALRTKAHSPEIIQSEDGPVSPAQIETRCKEEKTHKATFPGYPVLLTPDENAPPVPTSQVAALYEDIKANNIVKNERTCDTASLVLSSQASSATCTTTSRSTPPGLLDRPSASIVNADKTSTTSSSITTGSLELIEGATTSPPCRSETTSTAPPTFSFDSTLNDVVLSTFYTVQAELVPDSTSMQVAILTGVFSERDSPSGETTNTQHVFSKKHPNHSDLCASLKNILFETECDDCQPNIGIDGSTVVVAKNNKYVQFLTESNISGVLEVECTIGINYSAWMVLVTDNMTAVGGGNETRGEGAVHLFEKNSSGEWYETDVILPKYIDKSSRFGTYISHDRDKMAIGAVNDSISVYTDANGSWEVETLVSPPDVPNINNFGKTVEIKENLIVVGDRIFGDPRRGAVFIFIYDASLKSWQLTANITNDDCDNWFGTSLSILDDGLVVGCPRENGGIGAAYYYRGSHRKTQYKLFQKIQASNGTYYDNFAHNLQLSIDREHTMAVTNRTGLPHDTASRTLMFRPPSFTIFRTFSLPPSPHDLLLFSPSFTPVLAANEPTQSNQISLPLVSLPLRPSTLASLLRCRSASTGDVALAIGIAPWN